MRGGHRRGQNKKSRHLGPVNPLGVGAWRHEGVARALPPGRPAAAGKRDRARSTARACGSSTLDGKNASPRRRAGVGARPASARRRPPKSPRRSPCHPRMWGRLPPTWGRLPPMWGRHPQIRGCHPRVRGRHPRMWGRHPRGGQHQRRGSDLQRAQEGHGLPGPVADDGRAHDLELEPGLQLHASDVRASGHRQNGAAVAQRHLYDRFPWASAEHVPLDSGQVMYGP
jgi:hypothetical protein